MCLVVSKAKSVCIFYTALALAKACATIMFSFMFSQESYTYTRNSLLRVVTLCSVVWLAAGCASSPTQESTGEMVDSTLITTNVKTALAREEVATLLDIEVETFKDVVQLSGFVDSDEDKVMAGEIAQRVEGVSRVENSLVVKPGS